MEPEQVGLVRDSRTPFEMLDAGDIDWEIARDMLVTQVLYNHFGSLPANSLLQKLCSVVREIQSRSYSEGYCQCESDIYGKDE